ncbi:MAG: cytochrome b [Gammaproteobacteria bacterium]|nr:cytochrome b [Gammaproteobacteria bacterium]
MGIRNTEQQYGLLAIFLHWLVALVVIGMFSLGVWMTGLTYYDEWYKRGPDIHKSIGILLFLVMLARVIWRILNVKPKHDPRVGSLQTRVAHGVHLLLYGLIFAMIISGYLISTADGRSIEVFGLFSVPATITGIANMEDVAGKVHWYLALLLVSLVALHTIAALKHHFIDRDRTLEKMLGVRTQTKTKFHQPKERIQ